jgi:hypothetical protein
VSFIPKPELFPKNTEARRLAPVQDNCYYGISGKFARLPVAELVAWFIHFFDHVFEPRRERALDHVRAIVTLIRVRGACLPTPTHSYTHAIPARATLRLSTPALATQTTLEFADGEPVENSADDGNPLNDIHSMMGFLFAFNGTGELNDARRDGSHVDCAGPQNGVRAQSLDHRILQRTQTFRWRCARAAPPAGAQRQNRSRSKSSQHTRGQNQRAAPALFYA